MNTSQIIRFALLMVIGLAFVGCDGNKNENARNEHYVGSFARRAAGMFYEASYKKDSRAEISRVHSEMDKLGQDRDVFERQIQIIISLEVHELTARSLGKDGIDQGGMGDDVSYTEKLVPE